MKQSVLRKLLVARQQLASSGVSGIEVEATSVTARTRISHRTCRDAITRHPPRSQCNRRVEKPAIGFGRGGIAGHSSLKTIEIVAKFALIASFHSLRDAEPHMLGRVKMLTK